MRYPSIPLNSPTPYTVWWRAYESLFRFTVISIAAVEYGWAVGRLPENSLGNTLAYLDQLGKGQRLEYAVEIPRNGQLELTGTLYTPTEQAFSTLSLVLWIKTCNRHNQRTALGSMADAS